MTKLSNVVGGLVRDLARSHAISDASTLEIFDAYGRDAALSQLPVPRLTIKDAQLTLRFAVTDIQEDPPAELDPQDVRDLWLDALRTKVVPRALAELGRLDNTRVASAFDKVIAQGAFRTEIDPRIALGDDRSHEKLLKQTGEFLRRQVAEIAPSTRRSFEKLDVDGALDRALRDELPDLVGAVRELERARTASQADLSIAITRASLADVPDSQISELVLTVSMEELTRAPALAPVKEE